MTIVACVVREADYARALPSEPTGATGAQVLLADVKTGTPSHSVTGLREADLAGQVGRRIEVSGTVERARTTPVLTTADGTRTGAVTSGTAGTAGATGVTHEGAAAHEPADAVAASVRAGRATEPSPGVADPAYRAATLPRLNATSFKPVAGTCVMPANNATVTTPVTPARAQSAPVSPAIAPQAPAVAASIVARGCLARQTAGGTALTVARDQRDPLVLTNAVLVDSVEVASRGSVTGATPAATGSGTIPESVGTTGRAAVDATTTAFALEPGETERATLAAHVGERVEITGTARETAPAAGRDAAVSPPAGGATAGREQPAPDVAHPSAPARTIVVTAFRPLGGSCN